MTDGGVGMELQTACSLRQGWSFLIYRRLARMNQSDLKSNLQKRKENKDLLERRFMSHRCGCFTMVGYINRSMLHSHFCHVLHSLCLFPLIQHSLSIQDILDLPWPCSPSTKLLIKLPSILSHGCLLCPKLHNFQVIFAFTRAPTVHFWPLPAQNPLIIRHYFQQPLDMP